MDRWSPRTIQIQSQYDTEVCSGSEESQYDTENLRIVIIAVAMQLCDSPDYVS